MTEEQIKQNAEEYAINSGYEPLSRCGWVDCTATDTYEISVDSYIEGAHSRDEEIEKLRNQWISVEDRLPEATKEVKGEYKTYHSDEVFVRLVSKSGEVRHSAGYRIRTESLPRKECVWMVFMWSCEHVTHWMPIPELKKGE